jgi:hypothetical protein
MSIEVAPSVYRRALSDSAITDIAFPSVASLPRLTMAQ